MKDFPSAFTFITAFALIVIASGYFFNNLAGFIIAAFSSIRDGSHTMQQIPKFVKAAWEVILYTSLPFMATVGILASFLMVGSLFAVQARPSREFSSRCGHEQTSPLPLLKRCPQSDPPLICGGSRWYCLPKK